jgi:hypothetical protein
MQIIVDRIDAPPEHALTRRDVKAILAVLPKDWHIWLRIVHLKATLPEHSAFNRPVIYSTLGGPRLNVCSRGLTLEVARKEVLRELAIEALSKPLRMVHRLSAAETEEIDRLIEPLLAKVEDGVHRIKPVSDTLGRHEVYGILEAVGYTWGQAYQIVCCIEDERRYPTARNKANRVIRAERILRDVGIDPGSLLI